MSASRVRVRSPKEELENRALNLLVWTFQLVIRPLSSIVTGMIYHLLGNIPSLHARASFTDLAAFDFSKSHMWQTFIALMIAFGTVHSIVGYLMKKAVAPSHTFLDKLGLIPPTHQAKPEMRQI